MDELRVGLIDGQPHWPPTRTYIAIQPHAASPPTGAGGRLLFACVFFSLVFSVFFYLRVDIVLHDVIHIDSPKTFDKAASVVMEKELWQILSNTGILLVFWLVIILRIISKGIDSQTSGYMRFTPFGLLEILLRACSRLLGSAGFRFLIATSFIHCVLSYSQLIPWLQVTLGPVAFSIFMIVHVGLVAPFIGWGGKYTPHEPHDHNKQFWEEWARQDELARDRELNNTHYP